MKMHGKQTTPWLLTTILQTDMATCHIFMMTTWHIGDTTVITNIMQPTFLTTVAETQDFLQTILSLTDLYRQVFCTHRIITVF